MVTEDNPADCVLKAKVHNVKNLSQLLKCIHFKDVAVCFASKNGLKFVTEDSKCMQAAAFIGEDIFQEYSLEEELIGFRIELNVLMECLTILDGDASMNLYYKGYGFPLRLVIVEDDIVTDCSIKTMEALETLHFTLPPEDVVNKMIVDGPRFRDVLADLDTDSELVTFKMSPDPPHFTVATLSIACRAEVSVPKDADMVEEFISTSRQVCQYKYSQIKPALRTLQSSEKVSMQTGPDGLLCFQFMVKTDTNQMAYIEYFCTPVISDEEEE
ncbi:hypothetical protein GE061_016265 [Apolygus lucorum]|uniref:Cell cycle checkpoint protein RAD1 n=1 Tax=Apolygus lucorum TaxID=248454 RepID=A0A8S9XIC1_APOLU|nr:hypothetical protein GE061_016265 [Apolygus lucorum]